MPDSSGNVRVTSVPLRENTVTAPSATTIVPRWPSAFTSTARPVPWGGVPRVASIGAYAASRTAGLVLVVGTFRRYARDPVVLRA